MFMLAERSQRSSLDPAGTIRYSASAKNVKHSDM